MRSIFFIAALVSSALAYQVTRPNLTQGWTNKGAQTVSWERVNTDPSSFAIVLTNTNRDLLAADILLASSVDGASASSATVDEPSGGWPAAGGSYRVNFVRSSNELNTILAQSSEFNVTVAAADPDSSDSDSSVSAGGPSQSANHASGSASSASKSSNPSSSGSDSAEEAEETGDEANKDEDGSASSLPVSLIAPAALALIGSMIL